MGIFDFVSKQFIDVIEWTEPADGILMYRYPMQDKEIQSGAQLTVRESQLALFVNEGRIADLFAPGLHTLTTRTLPIITNLQNWDKAFASPFKSDLYFLSTRLQLDQKWGTQTPITVRDHEFGVIRIKAYGNYSYQISDPKKFYTLVGGTRESYTASELAGQLRASVASSLASFLGSSEVSFIDMAANQLAFSEKLQSALKEDFTRYGLEIVSFKVESLSLPEELEKRLDERAGVSMVGDLKKYAMFQAAASIPTAAANEGGVAGAGAGLGAGIAMGQLFNQALTGANQGSGETGSNSSGALEMIDKLHELLKKGAISQTDFDTKKAELLSKI